MARDEIRRLQLRKLRSFLRDEVMPFSPYYAERLAGFDPRSIRSMDDLARLPFTQKSDIVPTAEHPDAPRRFVLQPTEESLRQRASLSHRLALAARALVSGRSRARASIVEEYAPVKILFTTGRSAASLPFFLSLHDLGVLRETGRRICDVLELVPGRDRVVSLFPFAPHLAFWQVNECASAAGVLTLNTGGGRAMGGDRILSAIEKLRPTLICGMPGYCYHILRRARRRGTDLTSVEKIALGGEAVPPTLKKRIVDMLKSMGADDPRVASVYGFTEARQCWTECTGTENTGFHTSPDLSIIEIIDPETGEVLPDETTGELVYTTLDGRGSVLIRYRTGDIIDGGITHAPCPGCGRTMPRIMSTIQRVSNVKSLAVSKVKGTLVNFNTLAGVVGSDPDIEEWQVVLRKAHDDPFDVDEIVLHCALRDAADVDEFRRRIASVVREKAEVGLNDVIIHSLDDMIERVGMEDKPKEDRIVDLRPQASPNSEEVRPHGR